MKKIYLYIVFLIVATTSCDDYLDVVPKGKVIPETMEDYDLLLRDIEKNVQVENELMLSADDFVFELSSLGGDINNPNNLALQLYKFEKRFFNPDYPCFSWGSIYANIYVFNKVIAEIDGATSSFGYEEKDKEVIKAEAKYGRAMAYFYLVNLWGKHYNKSSANTDLAVPIVLKADVSQSIGGRGTVEQVYQQILKDLTEAVANLPQSRKSIHRPSKASAYALLARTYLYQANYDLALKNAELALKEKGVLSNFTVANVDAKTAYNEEQYTKNFFGYAYGTYGLIVPAKTQELFDVQSDVRYLKYFETSCSWYQDANGEWKQDCSKVGFSYFATINTLPSVGEMYVTIAECQARLGNKVEALNKLNELRKNRIVGAVDKVEGDFNSPKDLLKFVLDERRRELILTGTRLFDLKRLNLEPDFQKTVVHTIKTDKEVFTYKAEPNSGKLVMPIPANIKKHNKNL